MPPEIRGLSSFLLDAYIGRFETRHLLLSLSPPKIDGYRREPFFAAPASTPPLLFPQTARDLKEASFSFPSADEKKISSSIRKGKNFLFHPFFPFSRQIRLTALPFFSPERSDPFERGAWAGSLFTLFLGLNDTDGIRRRFSDANLRR